MAPDKLVKRVRTPRQEWNSANSFGLEPISSREKQIRTHARRYTRIPDRRVVGVGVRERILRNSATHRYTILGIEHQRLGPATGTKHFDHNVRDAQERIE